MCAKYVPILNNVNPEFWWRQSGAGGGDMKDLPAGWAPPQTTTVGGSTEAKTAPRYTRKYEWPQGRGMSWSSLAWSTDRDRKAPHNWRYVPNFSFNQQPGRSTLDLGVKTSERLGTRAISPMPVMEQSVESFINLFGGSIQEGSEGMGADAPSLAANAASPQGLDTACTNIGHLNVLGDTSKEPDGLAPAEVTYMQNSQACGGDGVEPNDYVRPDHIATHMGSEYSWDSKFANYIDREDMVEMRDAISTSHLKSELLGQVDHINMLNNEEMNARVRESVGRMYLTANEPNYHDGMLDERNRALRVTKVLAQQREDLTRHAEINTYYRKQFQMKKRIIGETALVFIIIYILYVLRSQGILPAALFQTFIVIILFVFIIFRLSYNLLDYFSRDNKYFEQYDWGAPSDMSYSRVELGDVALPDTATLSGCGTYETLALVLAGFKTVATNPAYYSSKDMNGYTTVLRLVQSFAHLVVQLAKRKNQELVEANEYITHVGNIKVMLFSNVQAAGTDGTPSGPKPTFDSPEDKAKANHVTNIIEHMQTYFGALQATNPGDVSTVKSVFVNMMNQSIVKELSPPAALAESQHGGEMSSKIDAWSGMST